MRQNQIRNFREVGGTVCTGSSDPFYIASLLYKMGQVLNILSNSKLYKLNKGSWTVEGTY